MNIFKSQGETRVGHMLQVKCLNTWF